MAGIRCYARIGLALAISLFVVAFGAGTASAATFTTTVVTGDDAGEPGIAIGKDNAIYSDAPSGLIVSKSTNGLVYPYHTVAATPVDQTGCVCPPGNLIAEGGGGLLGTTDKVGLIYATSTGGVKFARSTNGALTFTNVEVSPASSADTGQAFPVVANAGGGNLEAVWLEVNGNASSVRFARSTD